MIRLERPAAPRGFLKSARSEARRAERFFARSATKRRSEEFQFAAYRHISVRRTLSGMSSVKCVFCETPFRTHLPDEIYHFRPIQQTMAADGRVFADLYWWLGYEWENLFPCCSACARERGHRFPLRNEGQRATKPGDENREQPLLIDPCRENPSEHLIFLDDGQVIPRPDTAGKPSNKGLATIEVFGLNRTELLKWRASRTESLTKLLAQQQDAIRKARKDHARLRRIGRELRDGLGEFTSPEFPFVGAGRQIAGRWIASLATDTRDILFPAGRVDWWIQAAMDEMPRLSESARKAAVQKYDELERRHDFVTRSRWIERIEIENFKGIKKLELFAQAGTEGASEANWPWLVLLGENGTGKTSVLEATALALAGQVYANSLGLNAGEFVRRSRNSKPSDAGVVRIHFSKGHEPIVMRVRRGSRYFGHSSHDVPLIVLGYGATRLLPRKTRAARTDPKPERQRDRAARIGNLFDPFMPLSDPNSWILDEKQISRREFASIQAALRKLIPWVPRDWLRRDRKQLEARLNGVRMPLEKLSAGYQSVIALALDIYRVLRRHFKAVDLAEGVVLLDEIGEHLHPRWKKRIVTDLRRVFPRVQFIASTHDPLCLRGVRGAEVLVMQRTAAGRITTLKDLPRVEDMRVDQILTSPHFGLASAYEDDRDRLFDEYFRLLARPSLSAAQRPRLRQLRKAVNEHESLGRSRREQILLKSIDAYLAAERSVPDPDGLRELQEKLVTRLSRALIPRFESVARGA